MITDDILVPFLRALGERNVRFVVIDIWGANYYARQAGGLFTTQDCDLFLPGDPQNVLYAWGAAASSGFPLYANGEPLDAPRDLYLANRVVERAALVQAVASAGAELDLTLVMAGCTFEAVWNRRHVFRAGDVVIPVAALADIVHSNAATGRPNDRRFLATHAEALRQMADVDDDTTPH